ncbi:PREDICTED: uncharacterized protein LOC101303503 isoform 1 [Fragaria vesca subsp. vesca]
MSMVYLPFLLVNQVSNFPFPLILFFHFNVSPYCVLFISENKIVMVNMCSGSKSIGASANLGVKRSQVDTDDLSSHPPKISKASSCNWASAMNMLFKVNEPSSSLIPETCSTTVPTPISTKFLSAQDAQFVSPLGSPKMPGQSVSLDQQTHKTEKFSIAVFDKSCGDSGKDVRDVKAIPKILDGAQKCVSPASMAIEEESDLVQISKSIGDKMTQMAYLALEEERKMQNTLAAEVSRLKEVNENLLSRIDNRISENLQLEKLLKQERERSMLEMDTQKEKFKAEIIKCKTELVKSNVTNGKLRKKCDALKAELDEFVKRENLKQERERVMSLEKELESQKEKYRVDISEYQSQLVNSKRRAAQLLERATYLEAEFPNREAAAVSAFKTSSDYHKTMEAVFKKAYEDCRAVLKEYCPELDFMIIHDEEDCDQNSAEKDAQGKEVSIRTEDADLSNTDGPTSA